MNKKYVEPSLNIVELAADDIIVTSPDDNETGRFKDDDIGGNQRSSQ